MSSRPARQVLMPMARRRVQPPGATAIASWPQVWGIGGPITPDGQVSSVEAAAVLADVARRGTLSATITLRPGADRNWLSQAGQYRVEDRGCYVVDLDGGFGEVWQHKFRSNTRRAVRKAERSGLEIEVDRSGRLLDVFFDLYQKSLLRWAAAQHEPLWFTRLRMNRVCYTTPGHLAVVSKHFGANCAVWVARYGGQPAAANIVLRRGAYVKAWRGAMDKGLSPARCARPSSWTGSPSRMPARTDTVSTTWGARNPDPPWPGSRRTSVRPCGSRTNCGPSACQCPGPGGSRRKPSALSCRGARRAVAGRAGHLTTRSPRVPARSPQAVLPPPTTSKDYRVTEAP